MPRCGRGGNRRAKPAEAVFTLMRPADISSYAPRPAARPALPTCIRCQKSIRRSWDQRDQAFADVHGERIGPLCYPCLRVYPKEAEVAAERAVRVASRHWSKYRLTIADYWQLYRDQMGLCAICRNWWRSKHGLVIDHDHETGAVRALLCSRCNSAIGLLGDDPRIVGAATTYLLEHHARRSA